MKPRRILLFAVVGALCLTGLVATPNAADIALALVTVARIAAALPSRESASATSSASLST